MKSVTRTRTGLLLAHLLGMGLPPIVRRAPRPSPYNAEGRRIQKTMHGRNNPAPGAEKRVSVFSTLPTSYRAKRRWRHKRSACCYNVAATVTGRWSCKDGRLVGVDYAAIESRLLGVMKASPEHLAELEKEFSGIETEELKVTRKKLKWLVFPLLYSDDGHHDHPDVVRFMRISEELVRRERIRA